jgi:hypothetical protein
MDERSKKILELTSKFLEKQGCLWGEFDAEGYSYRFYGGRRFQCGTSEKEQGVNMNLPFEIGDILSKILEERAEDIPEEIDDYDGLEGSLSSISMKIYPKERKIMVVGVYQVSVQLEEEIGDVEMPDEVVTIMNTWGIKEGRVDFNGGGDSGYIEDTIYDTGGENQSVSQIDDNNALDTFLYSVLDQYGDWYNNEGATGYIELDVTDKIARYHVWANDYGYEDEFLFNVDF